MSKQVEHTTNKLLEQQRLETLEQLLAQEFESQEPDTQFMNEIMEVIRKKNPEQFATPDEVETAWKEFNTVYLPHAKEIVEEIEQEGGKESTPQPKRKKCYRSPLRKAISVAAIVAATLACLMIVQASGINILGAMGNWSKELFRFMPSASVCEESLAPAESIAVPGLEQVLTDNGIPTALAPKRVPAGMTLENIYVDDSDYVTKIDILFSSTNGQRISYSILQHSTAEAYTGLQFEKENASVSEYVHNSMRFYILENTDEIIALWSDGRNTIYITSEMDYSILYAIINCI